LSSKPIRNIIRSILNQFGLAGIMQLHVDSTIKDDGWFRSYKTKEAVDKNCKPIPWCTYSFIKFIEPRLSKEFNVFEYGSGNSTIWYAERVKYIVSVEHEEKWANKLKQSLPDNANLILQKRDNYKNYIKMVGTLGIVFDIIIIDGIFRVECVSESLNHLNDGGVIIFDNSEREEYSSSIEALNSQSFKRIDFIGLGPVTSIQTTTSIFYKTNNCLKI
jgi:hypothetical protein